MRVRDGREGGGQGRAGQGRAVSPVQMTKPFSAQREPEQRPDYSK